MQCGRREVMQFRGQYFRLPQPFFRSVPVDGVHGRMFHRLNGSCKPGPRRSSVLGFRERSAAGGETSMRFTQLQINEPVVVLRLWQCPIRTRVLMGQ